MKVRLIVNGTMLTAALFDSQTAQDFVTLLPLTLSMGDLFEREKFARLPKQLSTEAKPSYAYAVGDLALWPPGPDLAIYYHQDGGRIPQPGIILLGRIEGGAEAFAVPGKVQVTIDVAK